MKKFLILAAVAATACLATPAEATNAFQVYVSKVSTDVYRIDEHDVRIATVGCTVNANHSKAILITEADESGKLLFDPTHKCDVKRVSHDPQMAKRPIVAALKKPASATTNPFTAQAKAAEIAARDVLNAMGM